MPSTNNANPARFKHFGAIRRPSSVSHAETKSALAVLRTEGYRPVLVPQNIYEFSSFASRPSNARGLGLSVIDVDRLLNQLIALFELCIPAREIELEYFREMQVALGVVSKKVHDLRLVAACRNLRIDYLLTYNDADFTMAVHAGHIQTITPPQVMQLYPPPPASR